MITTASSTGSIALNWRTVTVNAMALDNLLDQTEEDGDNDGGFERLSEALKDGV